MASAKQIKAQKLFGMRSKRGDFRKGKKKPEYDLIQKRRARVRSKHPEVFENVKNIQKKWDVEEQTKLAKRYGAKGRAIVKKRSKQSQRKLM